jgi:hypothetical protein
MLAGLAALAGSLFPTMALAEVQPEQVPQSLQAATKAEVESKGFEYAGLCRVVNEQQPLPFGKYCSFVLSIEHDMAEVTYGPVASDQITRVNFVNQNGTWVKQGTATPTTPANSGGTPKPPSTGDGAVKDGGTDNSSLAVMGGIATLAVAGLGMTVAYSRKR